MGIKGYLTPEPDGVYFFESFRTKILPNAFDVTAIVPDDGYLCNAVLLFDFLFNDVRRSR